MDKVLIGIPTAEFARQAQFYDYLGLIEKPVNTIQLSVHGQSPARSRNIIIDAALKNECTHILFIDDDTCPPKDILTKLLAHDKDVVTGLYLMRQFPHQGIIFDEALDDGRCRWHSLHNDVPNSLIPIVNCGLGAVLIKTKVFEKLTKPYIRLGQCESDQWCDDIDFFNRVRKAGFELYCDLSVHVGHMANLTITPGYVDGKWIVKYGTNGIQDVTFPMVTLKNVESPDDKVNS